MKKIIRLTESDLHRIIENAVRRIIKEEGEGAAIGGGGATNCVGINVGGAAGQAKNHIDANALGNKKKKGFLDDTLDRTPGFSIGNGFKNRGHNG